MGWCGDGDAVIGAGDGEGECSITIAGQDQIVTDDAGAEAEHTEAAATLDTVLPVAQAEVEIVAAATAAQVIVGSTAVKGFVCAGADQDVVTFAAGCDHPLE